MVRNKKSHKKKVQPVRIVRAPRNRAVQRGMIPRTMTRAHKYHSKIGLTSASAGVGSYYKFCLNGLYDPDVTGTGHQPMGYDNYTKLYNRYRVKSVNLSATFISKTTTAGDTANVICVLGLNDSATTPLTTQDEQLEQKSCKYTYISSSENSNGNKTLKYKVVPYKYMGIDLRDDDYAGAVVSNPTKKLYCDVSALPMDSSASFSDIDVDIMITYVVEWFDPEHTVTGS